MKNTKKGSEKLWIVIGLIALISGIGLILSENYLIGISGSIVATSLILQNIKKDKDTNND